MNAVGDAAREDKCNTLRAVMASLEDGGDAVGGCSLRSTVSSSVAR